MNPFRRFWRHLLNLGILAILAIVPFWLYFQSGISFYTLHAIAGLMAIKALIAQCFLTGEYPLWNPFMIGGAPFHSGIGIFDPFLIAFHFFQEANALIAEAYLALVTAGWGMYLYLRKAWRLSFSASLFGSILYFTCPFFSATSHEQPFMAPPVYVPFIFLFYELHLRDKSFWKLLAASLFLSLTFLSGNLESFYFVMLYFVLIQTGRIAIHCYTQKSSKPFWNELRSGLLFLFFTFCFMAIDLLPTIEMIFYSGRNSNSNILQNFMNGFLASAFAFGVVVLSDRADYLPQVLARKRPWIVAGSIMALFALLIQKTPLSFNINTNLFFPNPKMLFLSGEESFYLFQRVLSLPQEILKSWINPRFIFYVQPPPYLFTLSTLTLFALTTAFTHNRYLRFLSALAIYLAIFAYTSVPNLNSALLHLDQIAYPRIMFIFFFIVAIIVAQGYERLLKAPMETEQRKNHKLVWGGLAVSLIAAVFYLGFLMPQADLTSLAQSLTLFHQKALNPGSFLKATVLDIDITVEALRYFVHLNRWIYAFGATKYVAITCLFAAILTRSKIFRFLFIAFVAADFLGAWNFYTFQKNDIQALQNKSPEIAFLKSINSNDRIGTMSDPSIDLWNFYESSHASDLRWNLPFFWMKRTIEGATLNLSPAPFRSFWQLEEGNTYTPTIISKPQSKIYDLMGMNYLLTPRPYSDPNLELVAQGDRYLIYRNKTALPRFYFAKSIYEIEHHLIPDQIKNPTWLPLDSTFIETSVPEEWRITRSRSSAAGIIRTENDVFNQLVVKTESTNAEFLATTEAYHPHWKAFIDGKAAPIVKTNFYFRGIFLSPGTHTVKFVYSPASFKWGRFISICTLLVLILSIVISVRAKRTSAHVSA